MAIGSSGLQPGHAGRKSGVSKACTKLASI